MIPRVQQINQQGQTIKHSRRVPNARRLPTKQTSLYSSTNTKPQTTNIANLKLLRTVIQSQLRHTVNNRALTSNILPNSDATWPDKLKHGNAFAITIRSDRWSRMTKRLGPWSQYVTRFQGTNGKTVQPGLWKRRGKLVDVKMKRGRIGCYDSHVRLWESVSRGTNDFALIFEDDANIEYSPQYASRISSALQQIEGKSWDVILLGHYNDNKYDKSRAIAPNLPFATRWQPMHAYLISKTGAQKLLKNAWPIRKALDVFVGGEISNGLLMYRMEPRLCGQLGFGHDTESIR